MAMREQWKMVTRFHYWNLRTKDDMERGRGGALCLYVCMCVCIDMCLYLNHLFSLFTCICLYVCICVHYVYVCMYCVCMYCVCMYCVCMYTCVYVSSYNV